MNTHKKELPALPWKIIVDPLDKMKNTKSGHITHLEKPHFKCRFFIGDESQTSTDMSKGFTIHNVTTNIHLFDLVLPNEDKLTTKFAEINKAMKEAARVVNSMLNLKI